MVRALDNVHVVITGASDGLGYAMAEALLDKGAKVAVASRPGSKEAVKKNLKKRGIRLFLNFHWM